MEASRLENLSCSPLTEPGLEFPGKSPKSCWTWDPAVPAPWAHPEGRRLLPLTPDHLEKQERGERYPSGEENQESGGCAREWLGWREQKRGGKNGRSSINSLRPFIPFPSLFQGKVHSQSWNKTIPSETNLDPHLGWIHEPLGPLEFGSSRDFQLPAAISGSAIPKSPSRQLPCPTFAIPG